MFQQRKKHDYYKACLIVRGRGGGGGGGIFLERFLFVIVVFGLLTTHKLPHELLPHHTANGSEKPWY